MADAVERCAAGKRDGLVGPSEEEAAALGILVELQQREVAGRARGFHRGPERARDSRLVRARGDPAGRLVLEETFEIARVLVAADAVVGAQEVWDLRGGVAV